MGVRWRLWGRTIPAPPRPAWNSSASALTIGAPREPRCRSASARFWASLRLRRPFLRKPTLSQKARQAWGNCFVARRHFTAENAEFAEKILRDSRRALRRFFAISAVKGFWFRGSHPFAKDAKEWGTLFSGDAR